MWFLRSWIYKTRYGKLPFKIRNFTESLQEECRESIKLQFKGITAKLPFIWTRLKLKDAKEIMHGSFTDVLGRTHPVKHPIFTENEVTRYQQHRNLYVFVFILMIFFEGILYSLMANLFISKSMRKEYPGVEWVFGVAFAIIFVAALHFAFKSLWNYFEVKYLVEKDNLPKVEVKPFYKNLILAILILVVFVITNVYTGFIRATIFEGGGTTATSAFMQKLHGPLLVFSIAITFIVALVMALLEKEIAEKSEKFKVFQNWKKQQKERKNYNTQVKDMLKKCIDTKSILIEEYWGTIKDLQRVFEREVDDDKQELYSDLNTRVLNRDIDLSRLDDATYQAYLPVAATRHELFEYGITSDAEIAEVIDDLKTKIAEITEFEKRNAGIEKQA